MVNKYDKYMNITIFKIPLISLFTLLSDDSMKHVLINVTFLKKFQVEMKTDIYL